MHGRPHFSQRAMEGKDAPADGVITGYGKVDGRLVAVCAYDFTVMAGSMGMTGELKVTRLRELALTKRIPFIWLLDSAGARIQEAVGLAVRGLRAPVPRGGRDERRDPPDRRPDGTLRRRHRLHPRAWPTSCRWSRDAARWRWPAPTSCGPPIGEDVTQEELGGSRVHCRKSGVGDMEVADDQECIERIKQYLSFMPQNCEAAAARAGGGPGRTRSSAPTRRCSTCSPSPIASPTTCTR